MSLRLLPALLVAVLALAGCSDPTGTGDKGYVTGDGQIAQLAPAERGEPVEVDGEDLDEQPMSLADLRGDVVVVNVWGSWCPPCREEQDELNAAFEELGDVEFVGIDIRDYSVDQAKAFVRTFDVPYPSFYAPDGKALLAFSGTLGPRTIPATLVLDAEGRVAASIIGSLPSTQTLVDLVEEVRTGG